MLSAKSLAVATIPILILSGCGNQNRISEHDRLSISQQFETLNFTPPPKSIEGVISLVKNSKPKLELMQKYAPSLISPVVENFCSVSSEPYRIFRRAWQHLYIGDFNGAQTCLEKVLQNTIKTPATSNFRQETRSLLTEIHLIKGDISEAEQQLNQIDVLATTVGTTGRYQLSIMNGHYAFLALSKGKIGEAQSYHDKQKNLLPWAISERDSPYEGLSLWIEAELALASGNLEKAERNISEAIGKFDDNKWGPSGYLGYLRPLWADIKSAQGKHIQAEIIVRDSLRELLLSQVAGSPLVGYHLSALARSLIHQGKRAEALRLTDKADEIMTNANVNPTSTLFLKNQSNMSSIALLETDRNALENTLQYARKYLASTRKKQSAFLSYDLTNIFINSAFNALANGKPREAQELSALIQKSTSISDAPDTYSAQEIALLNATAAYIMNKSSVQLSVVIAKAKKLIAISKHTIADEGFSIHNKRLSIITFSLLKEAQGNDLLTELTFALSDLQDSNKLADKLLRSQAALSNLSVDDRNTESQLIELNLKAHSLRKALADQLSVNSNESSETASLIKARLNELEAEQRSLRDDIGLVNVSELMPEVNSPQEITRSLKSNEHLIKVIIGQESSYAFTLSEGKPISLSESALGHKEVTEAVKEILQSVSPRAISSLADIPAYPVDRANGLYSHLISNAISKTKNGDHLIFVLDDPLSKIPLSILPMNDQAPVRNGVEIFSEYKDIPWLIRRNSVSYLPSARSLLTIKRSQIEKDGTNSFLGIADPVFQAVTQQEMPTVAANKKLTTRTRSSIPGQLSLTLEDLPRLPETRDELLSISKQVSLESKILFGLEATEANVKSIDLRKYDIVHFATHGLLPGELNGLNEPALALSSPLASNDTKNDGLLTAGEVMTLKLSDAWVILSACNTSGADYSGEEYSGLASAFMFAGSSSMLLSKWPVHSDATKQLIVATMTNNGLVKRNQSAPSQKARSLQTATIQTLQQGGFHNKEGRMLFSYAHPIFWAPFVLVGN